MVIPPGGLALAENCLVGLRPLVPRSSVEDLPPFGEDAVDTPQLTLRLLLLEGFQPPLRGLKHCRAGGPVAKVQVFDDLALAAPVVPRVVDFQSHTSHLVEVG